MEKLHCQFCGQYCGQRPNEIVFMMAKGADVSILATCADCTKPTSKEMYNNPIFPNANSVDDLMKIFGMKK